MSEFDVIVVGAGPAGASAAIKLASAKVNVLLVDRADPPGSKNVSGGVLWGDSLTQVAPDWEKGPVERYVEAKGVSFLTKDSRISLDFRSKKFGEYKSGYTVLRTKFDAWLAKKAKDSGVMLVSGVTVDKIAMKDGKAVGVEQGGETITSDAVILAEGANSRIAYDSGLKRKPTDRNTALGVKEIIKLPEKTITERFGLTSPKMGFASEFVLGFLEGGVRAGGFLYTNKESLSIGAVISMAELRKNNKTYSFNVIEQFKEHPFVAPLLEGGRVEEYSAHLVPEGGISADSLNGNGYMIAGDAAGFTFSNGLVLQGMNYAIVSGIVAAESFLEKKEKGIQAGANFANYTENLSKTFVMKDMMNFKGIDKLTWSKYVHQTLPSIAEEAMLNMFSENGQPKKHLYKILTKSMSSHEESKLGMAMELLKMLRRM
ncbi:MAG: FAD-dependent oxidoreductase [Candidatus Thermoplasmatota archaeon]|jgi:electron transfer flavoprotein-quinone oxidoreductase|nr:FAD-dependent oxidoreductase [Candidatus Thermoplasmatota archaeon]